EEQPLFAVVSPTAESAGYIIESEPEMELEKEDGDDEKISVQPHILMPFRSESEVKRLLAIPTPPLSPVSPTSYLLPLFLCHYHIHSTTYFIISITLVTTVYFW
nr:hypothetical protein [Tanacetum cinerariifolium]